MLDGIGPVPALMMPPSLNLESLLPWWRPYVGRKGHVDGTEWKDVHPPSLKSSSFLLPFLVRPENEAQQPDVNSPRKLLLS